MAFGCGSLSQVNDNIVGLGEAESLSSRERRRLGYSPCARDARLRKSRFHGAFRKRASAADRSLLTGELLVRPSAGLDSREYPLASLERRGGEDAVATHPSSFQRHCGSILQHEEQDNDEREKRRTPKRKHPRSRCSFSDVTITNVHGRGALEENCDVSRSSSSSSSFVPTTTPQHFMHDQRRTSHSGYKTRQQILRKIHGRRPPPVCPVCSGRLTYLYLSKNEPHQFAVHNIYSERDCGIEKLRHLLPPLCERCRTHLLFDHIECKVLMLQNFEKWLERGFGDDDSEVEDTHQQAATGDGTRENGCNSNNPLNVKLMVVPDETAVDTSAFPQVDDSLEKQMTSDKHASFSSVSRMEEHATPRLSNSSRSSSRSRFMFNEEVLYDNPIFTNSSSLSDKSDRRKGQLHYKHSDDGAEQQEMLNGHRQSTGQDLSAGKSGILHYFSSDDDPSSALHKKVVTEKTDIVGEAACDADEPPMDPTHDNPRASVQLVHTESEELAILGRYSMK